MGSPARVRWIGAGNQPVPCEKRSAAFGSKVIRGKDYRERETSQKIIQTITSIGFIAMLVVPVLDYRFG